MVPLNSLCATKIVCLWLFCSLSLCPQINLHSAEVFSDDFDGTYSVEDGVSAFWGGAGVRGPVIAEFPPAYSDRQLVNRRDDTSGIATLELFGLPDHESISIEFVFAALRTWDGSTRLGGTVAPDFFNVAVDGNLLFSETFDFRDLADQSFQPEQDVLIAREQDGASPYAIYNMANQSVFQAIPHQSDHLKIEFFANGSGWQQVGDETWGLDSVRVLANVPEPSTHLLAISAALLGMLRRKRQGGSAKVRSQRIRKPFELLEPRIAMTSVSFRADSIASQLGTQVTRFENLAAIGDVNSDGHVDIIGAGRGRTARDGIVSFEGYATLDFLAPRIDQPGFFDSTSRRTPPVLLDVDQDSDLDMVVISRRGFVWHANDGLGGFSEQPVRISQDRPASSLAAPQQGWTYGDLDNDSDIDFILANHWYENDGQGHFQEHSLREIGSGARKIRIVDMDSDGDSDVLYLPIEANSDPAISWLNNDGKQNFSRHVMNTSMRRNEVYDVNAGDINGDGVSDLIVQSLGFIGIQLHDGNGGFSEPTTLESFTPDTRSQAYTPSDVVTSHPYDVDSDGDLDVLAITPFSSTLSYYENLGTGQEFSAPQVIWRDVVSVDTIEIGNDGYANLFVQTDHRSSFFTFSPQSDRFMAVESNLRFADATGRSFVDFDNDGDLDAFSTHDWLEQVEGGRFKASQLFSESFEPAHQVVDVDRDGDIDAVSPGYWLENQNGELLPHRLQATIPHVARVLDYENDGDLDFVNYVTDLATDGTRTGSIEVLINNGHQSFESRGVIPIGDALLLDVAHMDSDDTADFLLSISSPDQTESLVKAGVTSDGIKIEQELPGTVRNLEVADIDGDGWSDLIVTLTDRVAWSRNENGILAIPQTIWPEPVLAWATADYDLDGDQDILLDASERDVLLQFGGDGFVADAETNGCALCQAVDYDADGDVDLVGSDRVFFNEFIPTMPGDFVLDRRITPDDIDDLAANLMLGSYSIRYDLNGDGEFDLSDAHVLVEEYAAAFMGDVDLDGDVDFADFLQLSENFGELGGWADGDVTLDGAIGFDDFLVLSENFGRDGQ